MKILHISDSHASHNLLNIPSDIDMVIFSGDESNYRDPYLNEPETRDFLNWYAALDIKHKVFVAGNHSSAIYKGLITRKDFENKNIIFLENESVWIDGIHIWGSPYSPSFGNWYFMKSRHRMVDIWKHIPDDVDILITHTPPSGVLDLSYERNNQIKQCGCRNLLKHVYRVKPKLHLFGHIHNTDDIINTGTRVLSNLDTIFSNGSVVTDGKFGKISSHGNILEI